MAVTAEQVKALRDKTGAGMMDCKRALTEANGDVEEAIALLRKRGIAVMGAREGRATNEGLVTSYIHGNGKIGVLVEVNCESDFVARTDDFRAFAKEIAMQIAAAAPEYVAREDVPAEALDREREILTEQAKAEGKPDHIVAKIVEGRLGKFYEQHCLLEQAYIRDDKRKVSDLLADIVANTGELISVRRFCRFVLGRD